MHKTIYGKLKSIASQFTLKSGHDNEETKSITLEETQISTMSENIVRTARSIRKPVVPDMDLSTSKDGNSKLNVPLHMHLGPVNVVFPWCSYSHETSIFSNTSNGNKPIVSFTLFRNPSRVPSKFFSRILLPFVPVFFNSLRTSFLLPPSSASTSPLLPAAFSKVCILGIHGWFPLKFFQKVVGEPTGTSNKFCDQMKAALQAWTKKHYHISLQNSNITTISLEHEGKVDVRVEKLYEQITNPHFYVPEGNPTSQEGKSFWQSQLESCQTIFVATHSQGCPTSIFLLSKLIENGIINPKRQHLVILSQAGISHGPFPGLRSHLIVKYLEADAARELFDFNYSNSDISKRYYAACEKILDLGGKLVLVSSWLDQVVPLFSSSFYALTHPNIFRAVFIDKENYAYDDFLSHLVIFALKLRNSGVSDQGLLVHLSDVVAGSLYFGSGHSTLYDEAAVYELAINFLFTTKHPEDFPLAPVTRSKFSTLFSKSKPESRFVLQPFDAPTRLNPYYLPWIMRCLVSDRRVLENESLMKDLKRLVGLYEEWNVGGSRVRKDLKYKLEPFYKSSM